MLRHIHLCHIYNKQSIPGFALSITVSELSFPDAEALYKLAGLYNISIDDLMHLTMNVDRNISYDAPVPTQSSTDLAEYLEFFNHPVNKKKYQFHTNLERELLFYFDKISEEDKKEIIEFTKIKARKPL